jgi:hypothetical protein
MGKRPPILVGGESMAYHENRPRAFPFLPPEIAVKSVPGSVGDAERGFTRHGEHETAEREKEQIRGKK